MDFPNVEAVSFQSLGERKQRILYATKCVVDNYGSLNMENPACRLGSKTQPASFILWGELDAAALGKAVDLAVAKMMSRVFYDTGGRMPAITWYQMCAVL